MLGVLVAAAILQGPRVEAAPKLFKGNVVNSAKALMKEPSWKKAQGEVYAKSDQLKTLLHKIDGHTVKRFVISKGNARRKTVSITIDDGPHPGYTERILAMLKELDVKATFFVVGHMVKRYPQLAREIVKGGHEIANHSFSHTNLSQISLIDQIVEYRAADDVIETITGKRPRYARPPGGKLNVNTIEAAAANGLKTVLWTIDPGDYANPGENLILSRVSRKLEPGAIILLHDGSPQMIEVFPELIRSIRKRGYQIGTLAEIQAPLTRTKRLKSRLAPKG